MDTITIDPNTLQTSQTTFDGTIPPLKGSGPLQPGQEYAPGYDSAGLPFMDAFSNAPVSQWGTWIQQLQAIVEANPTIAVIVGLGVLIMAANGGSRRR